VMKLLIVEDQAEMRQELKLLLSDLGEVYECSDGAEASSAYAQYQPDVVLMDIRMKQMNGIAATRALKALYPEARIAILTGYDDAELREAAQRAGACGYVLKDNLAEVRQILADQS
jgi:DNA-binding NarL/FixJ family response regulator